MGELHRSIKSEEDQEQYFESVYERYRIAEESADKELHYFTIAGFRVCLRFAGSHMVEIMTPALNHLRVDAFDNPDLTLCVWDSESTGVEMVPHPVGIEDFTDRGDIWGFYSSRFKTAFHWSDFSVNVMDLQRGSGFSWLRPQADFLTGSTLRHYGRCFTGGWSRKAFSLYMRQLSAPTMEQCW